MLLCQLMALVHLLCPLDKFWLKCLAGGVEAKWRQWGGEKQGRGPCLRDTESSGTIGFWAQVREEGNTW